MWGDVSGTRGKGPCAPLSAGRTQQHTLAFVLAEPRPVFAPAHSFDRSPACACKQAVSPRLVEEGHRALVCLAWLWENH